MSEKEPRPSLGAEDDMYAEVKSFSSESPRYVRDAINASFKVTAWTWDKLHEEDKLPLRDQANQLFGLVQKHHPENVESDDYVKIGTLTVDLERLYRQAVQNELSGLDDKSALRQRQIEDLLAETKEGMRWQTQSALPPFLEADKEFVRLRQAMAENGYDNMAQIRGFFKRAREDNVTPSTPDGNARLHVLVQELHRLGHAYAAQTAQKKLREQLRQKLEDTRSGKDQERPEAVLKLLDLEKQQRGLERYLRDKLNMREFQHLMTVDADMDERQAAASIREINDWIKHAEPGESLVITCNFISQEEAECLHAEKGGSADYHETVVTKIKYNKSQDKKVDVFMSEMLGVGTYTDNGRFRMEPFARRFLKQRQGVAGVEMVEAKQKDEQMEEVWQKYGHVDLEYRQFQVKFNGLTPEEAAQFIQEEMEYITELGQKK